MAEDPPRFGLPPLKLLLGQLPDFVDEVFGFDHDRTERDVVSIGTGTKVHRYGKKPCGPKRLDRRVDLLEDTPKGLLSVVDARDELERDRPRSL